MYPNRNEEYDSCIWKHITIIKNSRRALALKMRQTAADASNLLGKWRAMCCRPDAAVPVQGQISEIDQHSQCLPHGSSTSKQNPRQSRPRSWHSKRTLSVGTVSLRAGTHTRSIPYKIQQQLFCPAPLTVYSDATTTQGDNTALTSDGSHREIHFPLRCYLINSKGKANLDLISRCRPKGGEVWILRYFN